MSRPQPLPPPPGPTRLEFTSGGTPGFAGNPWREVLFMLLVCAGIAWLVARTRSGSEADPTRPAELEDVEPGTKVLVRGPDGRTVLVPIESVRVSDVAEPAPPGGGGSITTELGLAAGELSRTERRKIEGGWWAVITLERHPPDCRDCLAAAAAESEVQR